MHSRVAALLGACLLALAVAAPASADGGSPAPPGWAHVHWVPTDIDGGMQCGVAFSSMHPTGAVDFWTGPIDANGHQGAIQHWRGSMTFTGPAGSTVTLREDDWRFIARVYTADDGSAYDETTTSVGLLEELRASDGAKALRDSGTLVTRTSNVDLGGGWYAITSLDVVRAMGALPMRRSGFDMDLQGWTRECAYFAAHLR